MERPEEGGGKLEGRKGLAQMASLKVTTVRARVI